MPRFGFVQLPNAATERVGKKIAALVADEFTHAELVQALGEKLPCLKNILYYAVRRGVIERTGPGRYRRLSAVFTRVLPHGMVTSAMWEILFTDNERRLWSLADMTGEVQSYTGRNDPGIYTAVSHVFTLWYQSVNLEREGTRGQYRYRLLPHIKEQPVTSVACKRPN